MRTLQQDQAVLESAQREAREAAAWYAFISQHHEVISCDANRQVAISYHNGTEMTLESLTDSLNSPAFRKMLALQTTAEEREKLLRDYAALLSGSPETIQSAIEASKYLDNEQLRTKFEEIRRKRQMQSETPAALRKIIKENRPAPEEIELPSQFTRASMLAMSGPAFKALCDRYPLNVITKALNERR